MTDQQLRTSLQQIAVGTRIVDLGPRVHARTRVVRRRRRLAAAAGSVAAVLVAGGALFYSSSEPEAASPAGKGAPTVHLAGARAGGLAGAQLSVVDAVSGRAWLISSAGEVVRVAGAATSASGAVPQLSTGGEVLAFGEQGGAAVVHTVDGSLTRVAVPTDQDFLPAVSPDGRTLAYAEDNQVDAIELTLVPLDGAAPTTLSVTTSVAAGQLVPVVWSDDGSAVLVLDGAGATRVDLVPRPRAGQGVHLQGDAVLANGWAVAPDLSRFVMSAPASAGGQRVWRVHATRDGRTVQTFFRPADDRLIGWTERDRLVWWHRDDGGYAVVTTDASGGSPRADLRVTSSLSNLRAAWTGDEG